MDLLETVLRTANAMEYVDNFRKEGIEAQNLKVLTDEDLELIGVDKEETRKAIIKYSENLLFATESRINTKINEEYAKLVLLHINNQIKLHNNNLFCAITRPDIVNCNIELHLASEVLHKSIGDIKNELQEIKSKFNSNNKNRSKLARFFKGSLLGLFLVGNLYFLKRFKFL